MAATDEPSRARQSAGSTLSLKARALKLLSTREHSRLELARKLARHAEASDDIEGLLDELAATGWLSAERFVESFVHRKASRFGTERIRQELRQHDVCNEPATAALAQLRSTEAHRAHALWARRYGKPGATPQEQAKQARFLAGRGFSAEVIRRIVTGDWDTGDSADLNAI